MTDSVAESVVRDFFDTLNRDDLEELRPFLKQTLWCPMFDGITPQQHYAGDEIVDSVLAPARALFAPGELTFTITSLVASGDMVATELVGKGVMRDGRMYDNRYAFFFEVREGAIVAAREYLDSLYVSSLM